MNLFTSKRTSLFAGALAVAIMASLVGCSSAEPETPAADGQPIPVTTTNGLEFEITPSDELRALLPADILDSGKLNLVADPSYPPSTFKDENDNIIGYGPDLAALVAANLGLELQWTELPWDGMLAGLQANRYNAAWGGFSVTEERLKVINMVTYMSGGTSVLTAKGNPEDFQKDEDLCGTVTAVQIGTIQAQEIMTELQATCSDEGLEPVEPLELKLQTDVAQAITAGRAVAGLGDASNIGYFALQEPDRFDVASSILLSPVDVAFGVPLEQTEFAEALQATFNALIADGSYGEVLDSWNLGSSAVEESTLNPTV